MHFEFERKFKNDFKLKLEFMDVKISSRIKSKIVLPDKTGDYKITSLLRIAYYRHFSIIVFREKMLLN